MLCRKSTVSLAVWPLAPSCWKTYSPVGRASAEPIRDMAELKDVLKHK